MTRVTSFRLIGPGRAGSSLARALAATTRWEPVRPHLGRGDDLRGAAQGTDLLVIATPDAAVAEVAAAVEPEPATVVAHLAGSLGLDVLAPHPRRASLHPLVSLPDADVGAERLSPRLYASSDGNICRQMTRKASFAVAASDDAALALVRRVVSDLGGTALTVADDARAAYHAAACIASNHLVALLAQVERVAAAAGVPLAAYLDLVRSTVDNVAALGPSVALTGPAARGDNATIRAHLAAIDAAERPLYEVLADAARRLAATRRVAEAEVAACA